MYFLQNFFRQLCLPSFQQVAIFYNNDRVHFIYGCGLDGFFSISTGETRSKCFLEDNVQLLNSAKEGIYTKNKR